MIRNVLFNLNLPHVLHLFAYKLVLNVIIIIILLKANVKTFNSIKGNLDFNELVICEVTKSMIFVNLLIFIF
jgi:hypothetical protein